MSTATNQVSPAQPVVNMQPDQPATYGQPQGGQPVVNMQPGQQAGYGQPYGGQPGQQFPGHPTQQAMYAAAQGMANAAQPPPPVWMPKPASGPPGCPPGLEYLTQVDQILIKQQIELMEVFTNWEAKNKYKLLNSVGQQVYYAKEESETCMRQCCRENRSFTMHITDNLDNEVIKLEREFRCWKDSNWCACCNCCAHRISVEAPVGNVVGYVKQRPSFMAPKYVLMDADENDIMYIQGPCCVWQGCPCDIDFTLLSAKDSDTEVGKIQKQWGNLFQEMFTSADNFGVTFPMDLDVKMKAVVIGATFLIDFMYFEGKQNRGHHY